MKANVSSIIADLGQGQHEHLKLVIPSTEYNSITGYTHIKPTYPGDLKIKVDILLHNVIIMRDLHNEKLNLFCELTVIKGTLKDQIVTTIDPIHFKELKK